jgi:hypothetical protein
MNINKSLLELKGTKYVEQCKEVGYKEWWDYHPCIYCQKPFMEHIEGNWRCWPDRMLWVYRPMDNLSYVEWLNEQNNTRVS